MVDSFLHKPPAYFLINQYHQSNQHSDIPFSLLPKEDDEEEDKDATISMSQMTQFRDLIVRGPINSVESFDGYIRSAIDQIRSGKYVKNYLDMNNLKVTSDFTLKGASYCAESVN